MVYVIELRPLTSFSLCVIKQRKLDKSGRGYLTNDKVYAMMQEQLKMQKEMFKFKKIIFG